jgi:TM2 domain-containing membrane protein YozV
MKKLFTLLALTAIAFPAFASFPIDSVAETNTLVMDEQIIIAALLCWFLGSFGAHWFYLGKPKKGWARLRTLLLSVLSIFGIGLLAGLTGNILILFLAYIPGLYLFYLNIKDLITILTGNA